MRQWYIQKFFFNPFLCYLLKNSKFRSSFFLYLGTNRRKYMRMTLLNCFKLRYKTILFTLGWHQTKSVTSYQIWIHWFWMGLQRYFKFKLFLIGLGNRVIKVRRGYIRLRLGLCHDVFVVRPSVFKVKFYRIAKRRKRNAFRVRGNNWFILMNIIFLLRKLKFPNVYDGNGLRFFKEKIKLKPRKKWGVF